MGLAFNNHCPLVLTPDAVWLTLMAGLATHIDQHPEEMRKHFVSFDGKMDLEVKVQSGTVYAMPESLWEDAVEGFSSQIKEYLGEKYAFAVCNFSTTSRTDLIASEIILMGVMKHYVSYKMYMLCGLSRVTVTGTVADWDRILSRVETLAGMGLAWWTDSLLRTLTEIRDAAKGVVNADFWNAAYLEHRFGSGGQYNVSGWINHFYPYVQGEQALVQNPTLLKGGGATDPLDFPTMLVTAPVEVVNDSMGVTQCQYHGGLVGVSRAEDYTVQPVSGYAFSIEG